jgi:hypothetical protein
MKNEKKNNNNRPTHDTLTAVFWLVIEYKESGVCTGISLRYTLKGNDETTSFPD